MKRWSIVRGFCGTERRLLLLLCLLVPLACVSQPVLVPEKQPRSVFGDGEREIGTIWRNPSDRPIEANLRMRLHQTSSATSALVSDSVWKKLQLLPRQTVMESALVSFPSVNSRTCFLVEWLEDPGRVLGKTEVLVYPGDLLKQLKPLAGEEPIGVFDPQ